jgi:hypothetical protein
MAPPDGLGTLEMGVGGHDILDLTLGAGSDQLEEADEVVVNLSEFIAEPHSHVADDLLVTAAAGVKLTSTPEMMLNLPASHSFWTSRRPPSIFSNSSWVMIPDLALARAKAMLPRMPCL